MNEKMEAQMKRRECLANPRPQISFMEHTAVNLLTDWLATFSAHSTAL